MNESKPVAAAHPIKKLHITNAEDLFAKSHQTELRTTVDSKMEQEAHSTAPGENLNIYCDVKKKAFKDLLDADKACWVALAEEHNEKIEVPPTADYIYECVLFYKL